MTEQEKYLEGHRNCGIKVGDRVRVTRKAESYEGGWGDSWESSIMPEVPGMDAYVGAEGVIAFDDGENGFDIDAGLEKDGALFGFPYFVLEKI